MSARDPNEQAIVKAQELQADVDLMLKVGRDEEQLLARLQAIADKYHELANLWDSIGKSQLAHQAMQEEQRTRALMDQLVELSQLTATEAQKVLDEVIATVRSAATKMGPS